MTKPTKKLTAAIEGDYLVIRVPMNTKPTPSSTGRILVVASSHRNKQIEVEVQGKPVIVGVCLHSARLGDLEGNDRMTLEAFGHVGPNDWPLVVPCKWKLCGAAADHFRDKYRKAPVFRTENAAMKMFKKLYRERTCRKP